MGQAISLEGAVAFSSPPPVIQWKLYSGPGAVSFGDASQTNTTASFSTPGVYSLMLSADDGIHSVAYDASLVSVSPAIMLAISNSATGISLTWTGGSPPFVVERQDTMPWSSWSGIVTTSVQSASMPISASSAFFRVKGN
jgi:hypothetical protein